MSTVIDYSGLSVSERIQLVEDIWDSIAGESLDAFPLSDPGTAVPWEQVRAKLFKRPV
jgi:hypothetical protein